MAKLIGLYLGVLAMVVASYIGLVEIPAAQIAPNEPLAEGAGGEVWGDAARGRDEYKGLGCIYCHSQQIRPAGFGADIARGWGDRGTRPSDYAAEGPPLLGTMRTGPDLAAIARRQPSELWHHLHLYDPRSVSPGSTMPAFRFLYEVVDEPVGADRAIAIDLSDGRYLVPTDRARRLVAYLLTLDKGTGDE